MAVSRARRVREVCLSTGRVVTAGVEAGRHSLRSIISTCSDALEVVGDAHVHGAGRTSFSRQQPVAAGSPSLLRVAAQTSVSQTTQGIAPVGVVSRSASWCHPLEQRGCGVPSLQASSHLAAACVPFWCVNSVTH